jgi:hypothetical protein
MIDMALWLDGIKDPDDADACRAIISKKKKKKLKAII